MSFTIQPNQMHQNRFGKGWIKFLKQKGLTIFRLPKLLKQKRVAGHPWLICQSNGCPLTLGAYRKHFERRTLRELGTVRQPHSLRHFCGFYLKNALNLSTEDIKVFLRHGYISSTERYAQPTAEKARAMIARRQYTEFENLTFEELLS